MNYPIHTNSNKKNKMDVVICNIMRFISVMGVWTLFFLLYSKTGSDDYRFVPVVIFILGFYAILEIVTTVLTFLVEVEEQEIDTCGINTTLKELYQTIERKKNTHNNRNSNQERKPVEC